MGTSNPEDILIDSLSFKFHKKVLMLIVKGLRTKRLSDLNHCVASSHKLDICR